MTEDEARALIDRVMELWARPVPDGPAGEAAFGDCSAAELTVNGAAFTLAALVDRARALQAAYSGIRPEVQRVVTAPGVVVVAFDMHVTHTGTLQTPLGPVPPTGRAAVARTIDILTVRDGRITDIVVVADELGLLTGLGVLSLALR
jgi:ketosteroid isomerase-like protein